MTFIPTDEQQAIIDADLSPQCVIACAGSGKTATAVRRMLQIRKQLGNERGYVALLSYTNVAVETFRKEYEILSKGIPNLSRRVIITTVDSFITTHILLPHAGRVMGCSRQPFLVRGGEPFLNSFKVYNGLHNVGIEHLCVAFDNNDFIFTETSSHGNPKGLDSNHSLNAIIKLGKTGAYTYNLARFWVVKTLLDHKRFIDILACRYPFMLIDEAQDIGSMHGKLLAALQHAGSRVSLIGDPNQAIYEFADADGSFLRDFKNIPGTLSQQISENRRSVPQIVNVANQISGTNSKSERAIPARKHGAYYLQYDENNLDQLINSFLEILAHNGYDISEAMVLSRGNALVKELLGNSSGTGQGATEKFAYSSICRDRQGDIAEAFEFTLDGVLKLLEHTPTLRRDVLNGSTTDMAKTLRRELWRFLKNADIGLPSAGLPAMTKWHPKLKTRVSKLLETIEGQTSLKRINSWGHRLTVRDLGNDPLLQGNFASEKSDDLRIRTVHQAKGEGIGAVLYVVTNIGINGLLAGPSTEAGRIGYVAVTRAKDLLILAIPNNTNIKNIRAITSKGFVPWQ